MIAETTEPVIFITGKRRDGLCVHTALHRPSTEPVIFITGKLSKPGHQLCVYCASTEPVIFITGKFLRLSPMGIGERLQRSR